MGRKKDRVPHRYTDYCKCGSKIPQTLFIPFKVPLMLTISNELPKAERFGTKDVMTMIPNVGLIIDLTNTTYYDFKDFHKHGIQYVKIVTTCTPPANWNYHLPWNYQTPAHKQLDRFSGVVDRFRADETNRGKVIGVHCADGVSVTGYFICWFLIHRKNWSKQQAVQAFHSSRGHSMPNWLLDQLHDNYIEVVKRRQR